MVRNELFPSYIGCLIGTVELSSFKLHSLVDVYFSGRSTTRVEELRSSHILHISADVISFSELDPDMIFIGDLSADCVILYNTGYIH